MRAARLIAPQQWELTDVEKPQATNGNMLVRLERVAICGSDQSTFMSADGPFPKAPGGTGHEALGIVEDCPSGKYQAGQRVLLWGFDRGLFQEWVLASDEGGCIPLPQDFDPEAILISQLLGTIIHSFYKLGNIIGHRAVVLGQGPVGQLFNSVLRNLGANPIIAVDPLDFRLEVSSQMGATHTINPTQVDPVEAVGQITAGQMADLVVEAVGAEETFNLCPQLARRNANVICFGIPDKEHSEGIVRLRMLDMYRKELRLITTVGPNPAADYTVARDWIVQGRLDVRPILTHTLPFEEIQQGFDMAFIRPEKNIKVILKF